LGGKRTWNNGGANQKGKIGYELSEVKRARWRCRRVKTLRGKLNSFEERRLGYNLGGAEGGLYRGKKSTKAMGVGDWGRFAVYRKVGAVWQEEAMDSEEEGTVGAVWQKNIKLSG